MSQIFASERAAAPAPAPKSQQQEPRTSAPEEALANLQRKADGSSTTARLMQMQSIQLMDEEDMLQGKAIQRMEEEEALQGKAMQRMEEEEALQGKASDAGGLSEGGMPRQLQQGIEQLSGADMSDVQVHYNSPAPASVQAHAYAQGNEIHLASGQEQHLPHEAWHVAQQAQGRVQPTTSVAGTPVNDDADLEKEADVMGAKASQMVSKSGQPA